jgi:ubiquinone/menaquinone biosynthesis C-methylase UbiE
MNNQTSAASPTRYDDASIAGGYHARRYGDFQGGLNLKAMRRAMKRLVAAHVPPGGRILDVPCGTGQYTWQLSALGYRIVAADVAPEMVKTASTLLEVPTNTRPEFVVENIFALSFPAVAFDGAICIRLFNLLDRAERIDALRELGRVANTVIASYNHPYTLKHCSRMVRFWLGLRPKSRDRLSRRELVEEVREAGLELQELIQPAPFFGEVWLAVLKKPSGKLRS